MPFKTRNSLRWLCIGALLLGVVIYYSACPRLQHGLTATYYYGSDFNSIAATRVEHVVMASSNDKLIPHDRPFSIRWEGYLWVDRTRKTMFTIPAGAITRLLLDGDLVLQSHGDALAHPMTFTPTLSHGSHAITLEFAHDESTDNFFSAGLQWDTPLGKRLIPATFLYPSIPEDGHARSEMRRAEARTAALWLTAVAMLGLFGTFLASNRHSLSRREIWGLILVVGIALCLRLTYLYDLVTQMPNFDALPVGSDHRTYENAARDFVRGLWPPQSEFYRQPGFPWLLGNFHLFFGPSLRPFQILQLITGAITSTGIYFLGKRIFSPSTGWVAAILWATFPLAIFYDAQLVTHGLETQLVVWLIWLWLSAIKRPVTGTLIALGLLSGGLAVIRPALLVMLPLAAISLAWTARARWRQGAAHGLLLVSLAALPILPVTMHNYHHSGRFQLISANGPVTLYLGNNRDAAGIGQYSQAFRATHERVNRDEVSYIGATLSDIQTAPLRWLGLMTRKTALYFGDLEIPNNVDFVTEGTEISPLLAKTPLRYGTIVALGLAGITIAMSRPRANKTGLWLLITVLLTLYLTTVIFHVVSRFRAPTYGPLIILGAFALVEISRHLQSGHIRTSALYLGLLGSSSALVLVLPWVAENSIPAPTLRMLPAETVQVRTAFSEILELSGHDPLSAVEPGEPLFVTLYWKANATLSLDYYGTVQLLTPSGEKLTQVDQRLGTGSFPNFPSTRWTPGETVADQYLLFPPRNASVPSALTVLVAVYNRETGERLGETTLKPLSLTFAESIELTEAVTSVHAAIGPASLVAYQTALDTNELALTLFWESIEPASIDGVVFIHIFNSSGDFVLGQDLPPRAGRYPMTAWQPGESIVDPRLISLGDLPVGEYAVFVGVYDPKLGDRLPIVDNAGASLTDASFKLFEFHLD